MQSHLRSPFIALLKLGSIALHLLRGLWIVYLRLGRMDSAQQQATVIAWSRELVHRFGVEIETTGQPQTDRPTLMVANHISWLDVEVLHALVFCRFVAKSEIASWPVVGKLASAAHTMYIVRGNREHARDMTAQITTALRLSGEAPIAIFPEGTTSDGTGQLPFYRRLFQAALDAPASVQPIAITFLDQKTRTLSTACAYIGEETLLASIWRTLRSEPLLAVVAFCTPLEVKDYNDSRGLAQASQEAIAQARLAYTKP